jgi:hypothetical protein
VAGGAAGSSGEQGSRFEETLTELLTRLIRDDLGLKLMDVVKQGSGRQGGKDVQVRWVNAEGRTRFWHFECKSQLGGVIPTQEVAPKLVQEALAPHDLDVWCLALSDAEPSNEIDDLLNAAPQKFTLDFALTIISPSRESIRWLYSCHPDLHRKQYGTEPLTMTKGERARRVERFGEWLEEWSEKRPRGGPQGWSRVTVGRVGSPVAHARLARAYLRGLTPTCPWAAVVHRWSVARHQIEKDLLQRLEVLEPGLDYQWLISAAGEGKSTVLRSVAWQVARDRPEMQVHWADEQSPAVVPVEWLEQAPRGSRFLMCVDGTFQFSGVAAGLANSDRFVDRDVGVLILMADRGNLWRANRARQGIPSRLRKPPLKLAPLTDSEQGELIGKLEAHRLLSGSARLDARRLLSQASENARSDVEANRWEKSWLVPTVLRLVDSDGRPFEKILGGVLEELQDEAREDALRLLLAISLFHAAGPALPREIAERLLGSQAELLNAVDVLDQELEQRFDVPSDLLHDSSSRYVTHGAVVSDGFIQAACVGSDLRQRLKALCGDVPGLMAPEYSRKSALREDRFELLDLATRYLQDQRHEPELTAAVLEAWTKLDPEAFVAFNRLGNSYLRWVQQIRGSSEEDGLDWHALAARSREALKLSLAIAEDVLTRPEVPTPYLAYDLERHRRITYNSWAVLEATLGTKRGRWRGDRSALVRAVFLAILGIGLKESYLLRATGLLSQVLVNLEELALAAPIAACNLSLPGRRSKVVQLRRRLQSKAVAIPEGGVDLLPEALEAIVRKIVVPHWSDIDVESSTERNQALLVEALRRITAELPAGHAIMDPRTLVLGQS